MLNIPAMESSFEDFLETRLGESLTLPLQNKLQSAGKITLTSLDLLEVLQKEAGFDFDRADDLVELITTSAYEEEKAAYSQGVRDGFNLALHLLGMTPKNLAGDVNNEGGRN